MAKTRYQARKARKALVTRIQCAVIAAPFVAFGATLIAATADPHGMTAMALIALFRASPF